MAFPTERPGYKKTILSDLQGAWLPLRQSVVDTEGFGGWDRVLFHVDEAMSWETVRNLCSQAGVPKDVMANIEDVNDILREVLQEYPR